jgi:hypothetical protein
MPHGISHMVIMCMVESHKNTRCHGGERANTAAFLGLTAHRGYYPGTVRACAVQTVKPKNASDLRPGYKVRRPELNPTLLLLKGKWG